MCRGAGWVGVKPHGAAFRSPGRAKCGTWLEIGGEACPVPGRPGVEREGRAVIAAPQNRHLPVAPRRQSAVNRAVQCFPCPEWNNPRSDDIRRSETRRGGEAGGREG